jgi:hypothetical protein
MKNLYFIFVMALVLASCQSEQEKAKEKMHEDISTAWTMLDVATSQPETDLSAPMGFKLNCTKSEFDSHCESFVSKGKGRHDGNNLYITTSDFGGVEREVRISYFPYFSDPNTETDIVAQIEYIFDEFRDDSNSNGGWEVLLDSISSKFDDSWETIDFNLRDADETKSSSNMSNEYYKYWVRGNLAVQFYYNGFPGYATLSFCNMPKLGTKFFKDEVNLTLNVKEEVKQKMKEKASKPKIQNSAWDGSVWQVEDYLKKNLKDPKSYESIEWSKVIEDGDKYRVLHKYRAKNSFGGYVIEECIFTLDEDGNVIEAIKQ